MRTTASCDLICIYGVKITWIIYIYYFLLGLILIEWAEKKKVKKGYWSVIFIAVFGTL